MVTAENKLLVLTQWRRHEKECGTIRVSPVGGMTSYPVDPPHMHGGLTQDATDEWSTPREGNDDE